MPKKKTSTWDAEEWFYTELLQCGPVSEEWATREFKRKYYLHKGSPEIIMEVALYAVSDYHFYNYNKRTTF